MKKMVELVDTHAHLTFKSFKKDLDEVIARAKKAGIIFIVNATVDAKDYLKARDLMKKYKGYIYITLGAAPQKLTPEKLDEVLDFIEKYRNEYCAIGECGLDYYWVKDSEQREFTKKAFMQLVEIAKEIDKPLVIHCREAFGDIFDILIKIKPNVVVFHAFSDKPSNALKIVAHNWYVSIPTIAVRSELHQNVIKTISLENVVLETDAPFLSPIPRTRNEPANVRILAEFIAKIKGMRLEEVASVTTKNAKKIFNIR